MPPDVDAALRTHQNGARRGPADGQSAAKRRRYTYDRVGNRVTEQVDDEITTSIYNERNQLVSRFAGGGVRWRGTLNEVGNVFEAELDLAPGLNQVTGRRRDASGNVRMQRYEVAISGTGCLAGLQSTEEPRLHNMQPPASRSRLKT